MIFIIRYIYRWNNINDGNVRKKLGDNIYNVNRDFIDSELDE